MNIILKIYQSLKEKLPVLLLFGISLLLSACQDDCPTMMEGSDGDSCSLCNLYEHITTAAVPVAETAWTVLREELTKLVPIIAAVYVAIYTLRSLGSFGKITVADFLTGDKNGLVFFLFKITVIYLLLTTDFIVPHVIAPILSAGLEIGAQLSLANSDLVNDQATTNSWEAIFTMVQTSARNFNEQIHFLTGVGEAIVCFSTKETLFIRWEFDFMLYGFILFVFGWLLMVEVTLYLMDVLVRLMFFAVLLAPGIVFTISGLTMSYAKNIWNLFLNIFFSFVMLGIILGIVLQLLSFTMGLSPIPDAATNQVDFWALLNANNVEGYVEAAMSFGQFLLSIVCFTLMVGLVQSLSKLVDDISGASGFSEAFSPNKQASAPFAQYATKKSKEIGKTAGGIAWGGTKYVGHVAARITHADVQYNKFKKKVQSARGFLTGTGAYGYKAWWRRWMD